MAEDREGWIWISLYLTWDFVLPFTARPVLPNFAKARTKTQATDRHGFNKSGEFCASKIPDNHIVTPFCHDHENKTMTRMLSVYLLFVGAVVEEGWLHLGAGLAAGDKLGGVLKQVNLVIFSYKWIPLALRVFIQGTKTKNRKKNTFYP